MERRTYCWKINQQVTILSWKILFFFPPKNISKESLK